MPSAAISAINKVNRFASGAALWRHCGVPWQRARGGHGRIPPGIRDTCVAANIRLTHLMLSAPTHARVPFHALFSPSLCEAAPSVSKFICHTSVGPVGDRGKRHTLFMCLSRNTAGGVRVCVFTPDYLHTARTWVFALPWFCFLMWVFTRWPACLYFKHVWKSTYAYISLHNCASTAINVCVYKERRMCLTFLCLRDVFMHAHVYTSPDMCEYVRILEHLCVYRSGCVRVSEPQVRQSSSSTLAL